MFPTRSVLFCALFFSAFLLAAEVGDYKSIYLKSFRCNASAKFVYKNYSCFAKSFSRSFSTGNAYGLAKIPLYNITVSSNVLKMSQSISVLWKAFVIIYYKYGLIYRQVLRTPMINVCDCNRWLQKIEDSPNKLVAKGLAFIKASVPDLIHECPYLVRETTTFFF